LATPVPHNMSLLLLIFLFSFQDKNKKGHHLESVLLYPLNVENRQKLQNNAHNVQPRAKSTLLNLAKPQFCTRVQRRVLLSAVEPKMARPISSDTVQSLRKKANNRDTRTRK